MRTKLRKISYWFSVIVIGTILGFSLQLVKAWTEPSSTPPTVNVGAPINTGSVGQYKSGNFGLGGTLKLYNISDPTSTSALSIYSAPNGSDTGSVIDPSDLATGDKKYLGIYGNPINFYGGNSETLAININNNGNVGIGMQNSNAAKLEIDGNIKISGWGDGVIFSDNTKIISANQVGMPSGAVMAFDLAACPSGWSELVAARGRTIVGAGLGNTSGMTNKTRGTSMGEERVTLEIPQIPSHRHRVGNDPSPICATGNSEGEGSTNSQIHGDPNWFNFTCSGITSAIGGSSSHNNMQPSYVLLYCKKD